MKNIVAVIDYGVGNLYSLKSSLNYLKIENIITNNPAEIKNSSKIILPGVGAFKNAIEKLSENGMDKIIKERAAAGVPVLGICLGMQLLFDVSYEYGEYEGLSLVPGKVCPIANDLEVPLKIPQIGWNSLEFKKDSPLLKNVENGEYVYYVHSYYAKDCEKNIVAVSRYGIDITGIVQNGNVYGTQFHPEKSGKTGLKILKTFSEI